MRAYYHFLNIQTRKNPFIWLSFSLLFLIIIGLWIAHLTENRDPFLNQMTQNKEMIQNSMTAFTDDPKEKNFFQEQIETIEEIKKDYQQKKYQLAYEKALTLNEKVPILKENLLEKNETILLWQALGKENLSMEKVNQGKSAWSYFYDLLAILFPELIVLVITFILTLIISASYKEKFNLEWLFPISIVKLNVGKIIFSFTFVLGTTFGIVGITFLLIGLIHGFGSLSYPILTYLPEMSTQMLSIILSKSLILTFLSILALTVTTYFFIQLCKERLLAFFITILFFIGQSYLPTLMPSFKNIAHFLPGLYLKGVKCVTGELALNNENLNVTFRQGVHTLFIYFLVVLLLILIVEKVRLLKFNNKR